MKQLMLGNEAVARGLYEAGCTIVSSYPGTPSTEITECVSHYNEIYSEWAPNEKVAMEVAIGASIAGARSFCAMKHVGLNVAADPLFTAAYSGVNGGMVIAVADDPGMHSSQNEQDSRNYAIAAKVPMLEPSDSQECKEYTKLAFELSEKFDTPVLLRLSTRVSHSQSIVTLEERIDQPLKDYCKDIKKYVMMPGNAKYRRLIVEDHLRNLRDYSEQSDINFMEDNSSDIGIITSGISFQYAKEALGNKFNYLKLGMIHPLPDALLNEFANWNSKIYVLEELDPIITEHCKVIGLKPEEDLKFPRIGELSQRVLREKLLNIKPQCSSLGDELPIRPPVLCPGCPHRGMFYAFNKLKVYVSGDIGCYTLGALAPLMAMDSTICMGASISGVHGYNKARPGSEKNSIAVIGDSTFIHSGITGLIDIVYNKGKSTVVILDNSITGMTGHQDNPTTGRTIKGENTPQVSIEAICTAIGIKRISVIDPADIDNTLKVLKEELNSDKASVIIARRPCALLKSVKSKPPLYIDKEKCKKCMMCMKIGCPAISLKENGMSIDSTLCNGCGLCVQMCKFDSIIEKGEF